MLIQGRTPKVAFKVYFLSSLVRSLVILGYLGGWDRCNFEGFWVLGLRFQRVGFGIQFAVLRFNVHAGPKFEVIENAVSSRNPTDALN